MKCDVCGRRDAAALITLIVNGKKSTRRVCRECVKKLQSGGAYAAQMAVLSALEPPEREVYCPVCNTAWSDVCRSGRVGCASCYQAFDALLQPVMVRMNGMPQHVEQQDEASPEESAKTRIEKLREEMFSAVGAEEYERAAQLRDQIRLLEQEGGENGE